MKNDKIYPFTRNRYFYGKLLTVRDFEIEQRYFNDKRRMINRLAVGTGILSGLDVVAVNDRTVSIDPGVAIDSYGREIIVSVPAMHMLSDLEGFDQDNLSDTYYLCIEYEEQPEELVHSVAQTSGDGEYARMNETYALALKKDYRSSVQTLKEKLLLTRYPLYSSDEMDIELTLYDLTSTQGTYDVRLSVNRKSEGIPMHVSLALEGTYIMRDQALKLEFNADDKSPYGLYTVSETVSMNDIQPVVDTITLTGGSFTLSIGQREIERAIELRHQVEIISDTLSSALHKRYYELPFDELIQSREDQAICLGKINLIPAGETYLIDGIDKPDTSDFLIPQALGHILSEVGTKPQTQEPIKQEIELDDQILQKTVDDKLRSARVSNVRTGVYTFDQPEGRIQEKALFSEEIEHGLGRGEGFLTFALEHEPDVADEYGSARQVFFGDPSVFEDSAYTSEQPDLKVSGVLYPNKGSFRMALSGALKEIDQPVRIRWRLEKSTPETNQPLADDNPLRIEIQPNPGHILPRQTILLKAIDKDGELAVCTWAVTDDGAGSIDENGLYSAPAKEGVYTITATSDKGYVSTGYIVVEND